MSGRHPVPTQMLHVPGERWVGGTAVGLDPMSGACGVVDRSVDCPASGKPCVQSYQCVWCPTVEAINAARPPASAPPPPPSTNDTPAAPDRPTASPQGNGRAFRVGDRVRVVGYAPEIGCGAPWIDLAEAGLLPVGSEHVVDENGLVDKGWITWGGAHQFELVAPDVTPAPSELDALRADIAAITGWLDQYKIAEPGGTCNWSVAERVQIACMGASLDTDCEPDETPVLRAENTSLRAENARLREALTEVRGIVHFGCMTKGATVAALGSIDDTARKALRHD